MEIEKKFNIDEVINAVEIYGNIIHLTDKYISTHGVLCQATKRKIKKIIDRAKNEYPIELKDKKFCFHLDMLEEIVIN